MFTKDEEVKSNPTIVYNMLSAQHKEVNELSPPTLSNRLAAITEVYSGKTLPVSQSEEELRFSPLAAYDWDDSEDKMPIPIKENSLQDDLKREILDNAKILISFNALYREAHLEYIYAREAYCNSKHENDFVKLQRKETEINLMSKPIFMAEKMHKLLSETLLTLEKHGIDSPIVNNNNAVQEVHPSWKRK